VKYGAERGLSCWQCCFFVFLLTFSAAEFDKIMMAMMTVMMMVLMLFMTNAVLFQRRV